MVFHCGCELILDWFSWLKVVGFFYWFWSKREVANGGVLYDGLVDFRTGFSAIP